MNAAPPSLHVAGTGRYQPTHELARGGMGVVYRAIDRTTGRLLALKRSLAKDGEAAELCRSMFEREYRMLVSLRHPYIIEVYDFGVDELGPYYTMELLDGVDLRARCPVPWREACSHLRDVAAALALLHSRRLLHCDVSVANIRLTGEGRARLLDFGTLASFGRASVIAGSPPGIAPEVLDECELDQRVDLYALGATAYYALCGRHAYPAQMLATLSAVWAQGVPPPPSTYVPDVPPELDALVMSLLDHDPLSRPTTAAEVIDRLEVIAGLTPDRDPRVLRSYLHSTVMVGRDQQRKALSKRLAQALAGRTTGVLIEGASGLGKSFLLEDILQEARVAGARVLTVHARAHSGSFGVWSALLHDATIHRPAAPVPTVTPGTAEQTLFALARTAPLVLAIEDLHEADPDSLAALANLTKSVQNWPILVVATVDPTRRQTERPALRLLRMRFKTLELTPFDEKTTHAFVVGLFGDVPSAARLATFLHDHAAGNPQVCRAVIDHMIDQGFIRYAAGTWVLPSKLPEVGPNGLDLGALADAAFESRISHWSPPLRRLAVCLSPHRRAFTLDMVPMLTAGEPDLEQAQLPELMWELVREGVLVEGQGSFTFARPAMQRFFYSRLSEAEKERQHLRLADALAESSGKDPKRSFEIGFHYLRAGEMKKARAQLNRNVEHSLRDPDMLIQSVPDLWALLKHQRDAGATDEDVQFIEGMLVLGGYYLDPLVYDSFGERVLRVMHRTLGFTLAKRLSRWIGRPLGLTIGLTVGWLRSLFRQPYLLSGGSFAASIVTFIGVCVSMNAGASVRVDRKVHPLLLSQLDVLGALPLRNALRFLYDQFKMGKDFTFGRAADARAGLYDQLERLPKTSGLDRESRHQLEIGLLFGVGMNELLRTGAGVPAIVERIEQSPGKQQRMQAQFLRWQYHLARGELSAAKREEERFDEMNTELGSRWFTDVWAASGFTAYHLTADVLGLKRTLHRMDLVLPLAPGLHVSRDVANAMYEGHRGRPDLALRIYEQLGDQLAPFEDPIWSLGVGHRAECLNTLGRHAEALTLCEEALKNLSEVDRQFALLYQQLERESALALAGLGRFEEATALADRLLSEHADGENPLLRGLLNLDRARIAQLAGDQGAFNTHLRAARVDLLATSNPAALARINRLVTVNRTPSMLPSAIDGSVATLRQLAGPLRRGKASSVLQRISRDVRARSARLYLVLYGKAVLSAELGNGQFETSVIERAADSLAQALDGELRASEVTRVLSAMPRELGASGKLLPLVTANRGGECQLVGMLSLTDCEDAAAYEQFDLSSYAEELLEIDEATEVV